MKFEDFKQNPSCWAETFFTFKVTLTLTFHLLTPKTIEFYFKRATILGRFQAVCQMKLKLLNRNKVWQTNRQLDIQGKKSMSPPEGGRRKLFFDKQQLSTLKRSSPTHFREIYTFCTSLLITFVIYIVTGPLKEFWVFRRFTEHMFLDLRSDLFYWFNVKSYIFLPLMTFSR